MSVTPIIGRYNLYTGRYFVLCTFSAPIKIDIKKKNSLSGTNICLNTAQQPESWKSKCKKLVCWCFLFSNTHAE